jgi:hypothetical protein
LLGHCSCIGQGGYVSSLRWFGSSSMEVAYVDGGMASRSESAHLLCKMKLPLPSDMAQRTFGRAAYATEIKLKYNWNTTEIQLKYNWNTTER